MALPDVKKPVLSPYEIGEDFLAGADVEKLVLIPEEKFLALSDVEKSVWSPDP